MMIKIYLIGFIVAFIIEIFTHLRIREFDRYTIPGMIMASCLSWFWVFWFAMWVYDMMGWDYEYPKADPYSMMAWRLKRRGEDEKPLRTSKRFSKE